jgi:hypothetical protein
MGDWMYRLAQMLAMIYEAIRDEIRTESYLQIDETPVHYQNPGNGKCSQGYLWPYHAPGKAVFFEWHTSRASTCLDKTLKDFKGIVQSDGYSAYGAFKKRHPHAEIKYAACWAHARRKFSDAVKAQGKNRKPGKAQHGLALIQKLYRVEKQAKQLTPLERFDYRQQHATPILERLRRWLDDSLPQVLPGSAAGKALNYLHNEWDKLTCYLDDGRLEIDNNLAENAIRPFVVGRKNWLFSTSVAGVNASANLYSLIETSKANGLEPYAYLRYLFAELPRAETVEAIEALLPGNVNPQQIKL